MDRISGIQPYFSRKQSISSRILNWLSGQATTSDIRGLDIRPIWYLVLFPPCPSQVQVCIIEIWTPLLPPALLRGTDFRTGFNSRTANVWSAYHSDSRNREVSWTILNPFGNGRFLDPYFKVLWQGVIYYFFIGASSIKSFVRARIFRYGLPTDILSKGQKTREGAMDERIEPPLHHVLTNRSKFLAWTIIVFAR